jgi:hypothetical protein
MYRVAACGATFMTVAFRIPLPRAVARAILAPPDERHTVRVKGIARSLSSSNFTT